MLAHPPAPNALLKSPSPPALAAVDGGEMVFPPFPLRQPGEYWEAAAASPVGWKPDESRTKAGRKPSRPASSPGGDGGLTPQPEIAPSHKMVCLFPARGVRDHGAKGCTVSNSRGEVVFFFSTSASDLVVGIHHIPGLCLSFPVTREGRG